MADVARWALIAEAVDPYLVGELGFGVSHFTEIALRYIDHAVSMLAPAWPTDPRAGENLLPLTAEELEAAGRLLDSAVPQGLLVSPEYRAALDWATAPPGTLKFDVTDPESSFDRFLAVTLPTSGSRDYRFWLPLAFLPEATAKGVVTLAGRAAEDPGSVRRFAQLAADRLRRALFRFADEVIGAPDGEDGPQVTPNGNIVQWVAMIGDGRALAVQLVTQLEPGPSSFNGMPEAVRVAQNAREHPGQAVRVRVSGGHLDLGTNIEVVPLLVVASSGHVAPPHQPPGLPIMSLDDVIWASTTADEKTDLYLFCRELASGRKLFAFESINIWEWWRANGKVLFGGAQAPALISIEPHWGRAEWQRSANRAELERALAALDMSPIRDWVDVDDLAAGPPTVYGWSSWCARLRGEAAYDPALDETLMPPLVGWQIHLSSVPVAIRSADETWAPDDRERLSTLAGSIAYGIDQVATPWQYAHQGVDVAGYVIGLSVAQPNSVSGALVPHSIQVGSVQVEAGPTGNIVRVVLLVDGDRLVEDAVADKASAGRAMATACQEVMARAGVAEGPATTVRTAWEAATPTYAAEITTSRTARSTLPQPWKLDDALVASAHLDVAKAVQRAGVEPGTYTGDEAKRLDGDHLGPAALEQLTRLLNRHALSDIVATGMRQLDRAVAARERALSDIRRARTMQLAWDPDERAAEVKDDHLRLRRCNETAIEAALRAEPTGSEPVDQIAWVQILAAAWSYLEATSRSEAIHHQLNPTALTITTSYEIKTTPDTSGTAATDTAGQGRVYALDLAAYRRARMPDRPNLPDAGEPDPTDTPDAAAVAGLVPEQLDTAMLQAYGASAADIVTALAALALWPVPADGDHLVRVERDAAVGLLLDTTDLGEIPGGPDRAEAVLTILTSTASGLQSADWRPWHARSRQRRLLTQPLVELPTGIIHIAPHFCYAAISVYLNYLRQGMLPWSKPEPPQLVKRALDDIRDERNKDLEKEVDELLSNSEPRYITRSRVKPTDPQRLGVPSLSGEIDTLAGRPGSRILWLVEVKDPADVFVTPEIRRHLDTFFVGSRKKHAYLTQLQRKLADLAPHTAQVAAALGLPPLPDEAGYKVRPLFVTRHPVPAAFVGEPTPFTSIDKLLEFITDQELRMSARRLRQ
ncbi:hypothetical protein ABT023_09735 [Micromonospora sp. NPDC002296]|uniref:hypothetical protein n=1 Tax=Micromonospora sp. NPDC002296 TaxID=3154271 RepID=UPI00332614F3